MKVKMAVSCMTVLTLITGCDRDDGQEAFNKLTSSMKQHKEDKQKPVLKPDTNITNGMSETEFKSVFGEPKGSITKGSKEILMYDDFQVALINGSIVDIPENINEICAELNEPSALDKLKNLPNQIPAPQELKEALAKRKSYTLLNSKNEPIDHTSLLTTGKVTVVEFYADELEACHTVNAELEKLITKFDLIELRKIEIGEWNSETAKKYHITTVPDIRVLNQYGFLVSQPVTRIEIVDEKIDLSRVAEAIELALKH